MNDVMNNFLESMRRSYACGGLYPAELTANTGVAGMFDTLGDRIISADARALKLASNTKEFTKAGVAVRQKSAIDLSIAASVASGYGAANNLTELKNLNIYTMSALRYDTLENQILNSKKIMEVITPKATVLATVGLDTAMFTLFNDDLDQMQDLTHIPKDMIAAHKVEKELLEADFVLDKKFLDEQLDKAMQLYKIKNMAFYLSYTAARRARHHHLKRKLKPVEPTTGTLEILVLQHGSLVNMVDVNFLVASLNITMMTDADGEIFKDGFAPGTYHGKLFKTGFKDVVFDFTIVAGKTCAVQFLMEVDDSEPDVPPVS